MKDFFAGNCLSSTLVGVGNGFDRTEVAGPRRIMRKTVGHQPKRQKSSLGDEGMMTTEGGRKWVQDRERACRQSTVHHILLHSPSSEALFHMDSFPSLTLECSIADVHFGYSPFGSGVGLCHGDTQPSPINSQLGILSVIMYDTIRNILESPLPFAHGWRLIIYFNSFHRFRL